MNKATESVIEKIKRHPEAGFYRNLKSTTNMGRTLKSS